MDLWQVRQEEEEEEEEVTLLMTTARLLRLGREAVVGAAVGAAAALRSCANRTVLSLLTTALTVVTGYNMMS